MHIDYDILSKACMRYVFKFTGICMYFHLGYHMWQAYDQITITLAFNNNHKIYYHMDMK